MIAVSVVICVQDNQAVVSRQMVDVATGVYQQVHQQCNLRFGQAAVAEQDTLAVIVVHSQQVAQAETMHLKQ
mgnify:CR=1 FL=1